MYYYGYRFYLPTVGRWINRDLEGEGGIANLHIVYYNDNVNWWDFLGSVPGIGRWYGNWAGKGYSGGMTDEERKKAGNIPINWNIPGICPIDEAAKRHDACYEACETGRNPLDKKTCPVPTSRDEKKKCLAECDRKLVAELKNMDLTEVAADYPKAKGTRRLRVYQQMLGYFDK